MNHLAASSGDEKDVSLTDSKHFIGIPESETSKYLKRQDRENKGPFVLSWPSQRTYELQVF